MSYSQVLHVTKFVVIYLFIFKQRRTSKKNTAALYGAALTKKQITGDK